jgi:Flp pilus assembly protein TadD
MSKMRRKTENSKKSSMQLRPDKIEGAARKADAKGHCALAVELYEAYLSQEPARPSARYRAAVNLLEAGRGSDAARVLRSLNPPSQKRWLVELLWGRIYLSLSQVSVAVEHLRKVIRLKPKRTEAIVILGNCLFTQGKLREANHVLMKGLKAFGDLDEVLLNLGLVKRAQGKFSEARACLRAALRITPNYDSAKLVLRDVEACLKLSPEVREAAKEFKKHLNGASKSL